MNATFRSVPLCCAAALLALLLGASASAGPKNQKTYCISGTSNGGTWGWELEDAMTFATLATQSGLSVGSGQPASALRDTFVGSMAGLEAAPPYFFVRATNDPSCPSPDAAFFISGQDDFNLLVTPSGGGPATIVGPSIAVSFNPDIIQVPEPGTHAMLLAGVWALIGLTRRRR
jgi:hypothetical protein